MAFQVGPTVPYKVLSEIVYGARLKKSDQRDLNKTLTRYFCFGWIKILDSLTKSPKTIGTAI